MAKTPFRTDQLDPFLAAVDEASELLLSYWKSPGLAAVTKADGSPVTAADRASDEFFQRVLPSIIPVPVVSEESNLPKQESLPGYWLVDPLDATQSFLAGQEEFAIVAAYLEKGVPRLGAIAAPAKHTVYYAVQGMGAWKRSPSGIELLRPRIRLPSSPRRVVTSGYPSEEGRTELESFQKRYEIEPYDVVQVPSAYKSGLLAQGDFEIVAHFDPCWLWDLAGVQCIFNEIGCSLVESKTNTPIRFDPGRELRIPGYLGWIPGAV